MREKLALDTPASLGAFEMDGSKVVDPAPVDLDHLHAVHPPEYVGFVERTCAAGGYLDGGDAPGAPGLYEGALSAVGGTLRGAKGILGGEFDHAFDPGGGLHHAHPSRASGFCVFHDIAVAVRALQAEQGLRRIAVADIDGHHGDGTQDIFYGERCSRSRCIATAKASSRGPGRPARSGREREGSATSTSLCPGGPATAST